MRTLCCSILVLIFAASASHSTPTEFTLVQANPSARVVYVNPAYSPDGRSIAYVAISDAEGVGPRSIYSDEKSIRVAALQRGEWTHRVLLESADWPLWSPDGKHLAFARNGICLLHLRTGKVRRLTRDRLPKSDRDEALATIDYPVSFSPNGRYVAYYKQMWEENQTRVFDLLQNRDSGIFKGLYETDPRYAKYAGYKWFLGNYFDWSPDSRQVLSAFNWFMDNPVPTRLLLTDIARCKWRTVLKGYRVYGVIYPKSRYAWLFLADRLEEGPETDTAPPEGPGIYRLDLDSRKLTKLSNIREWVFASPDFRRFAFTSHSRGSHEPVNLYLGETRQWQFRLIAEDAADPWSWHIRTRFVSWSRDGKSLAYVTHRGDIKLVRL